MTWVIFAVFEALVVGGTLVLLLLAFEGIKASRKPGVLSGVGGEAEIAAPPRVLSRAPFNYSTARRESIEDLAMERFQQYLREEQEQVEQFVSKPSVASLYRNSDRSLTLN